MNNQDTNRLAFWDGRSTLGIAAGSGDINLKLLEIKAIQGHIQNYTNVLDAGCGNSYTLEALANEHKSVNFFGFDYSPGMVTEAQKYLIEKSLDERVKICRGNLLDPPFKQLQLLGAPKNGFDCVFTERSIINLNTLEDQISAILHLWKLLRPGGQMILCESFLDGLNEINYYRHSVGLSDITPPWHNRYLSLDELSTLLPQGALKLQINEFSGTYYFVSRVIHALYAFRRQTDPSYDDPLNIQSLDVKPLPVCGQSKVITFSKPE